MGVIRSHTSVGVPGFALFKLPAFDAKLRPYREIVANYSDWCHETEPVCPAAGLVAFLDFDGVVGLVEVLDHFEGFDVASVRPFGGGIMCRGNLPRVSEKRARLKRLITSFSNFWKKIVF